MNHHVAPRIVHSEVLDAVGKYKLFVAFFQASLTVLRDDNLRNKSNVLGEFLFLIGASISMDEAVHLSFVTLRHTLTWFDQTKLKHWLCKSAQLVVPVLTPVVSVSPHRFSTRRTHLMRAIDWQRATTRLHFARALLACAIRCCIVGPGHLHKSTGVPTDLIVSVHLISSMLTQSTLFVARMLVQWVVFVPTPRPMLSTSKAALCWCTFEEPRKLPVVLT